MGAFEYGGFGSRRKRNLDLSSSHRGIRNEKMWEEPVEEDELETESVEEQDSVGAVRGNQYRSPSVSLPRLEKDKRETTKLTLYVENQWISRLNELKVTGQIPSFSWLVNELLKQVMKNN
jgi:hypothetical protein